MCFLLLMLNQHYSAEASCAQCLDPLEVLKACSVLQTAEFSHQNSDLRRLIRKSKTIEL